MQKSLDATVYSLVYPLIATPVIQATVPCQIQHGVAVLPGIGPVRNRYIQSVLGYAELNGIDGVLRAGASLDVTNATLGATEAIADFMFYASDRFDLNLPLTARIARLLMQLNAANHQLIAHGFVVPLRSVIIEGPRDLFQLAKDYRIRGHRDLALRHPDKGYGDTQSIILSLEGAPNSESSSIVPANPEPTRITDEAGPPPLPHLQASA